MPEPPFQLTQTVFKTPAPSITVIPLQLSEVTATLLDEFLETAPSGHIGVASSTGSKCALSLLVLSSSTVVLQIRLPRKKGDRRDAVGLKLLESHVLCCSDYEKLAFDMERISTSLHLDHKLGISEAIDLQSLLPKVETRASVDTVMAVLGGQHVVQGPHARRVFGFGQARPEANDVHLRAWASWHVGTSKLYGTGRKRVSAIDTGKIDSLHLDTLARCIRDADQIVALKPTRVKNDVDTQFSHGKGTLRLHLTRFKTRVRPSSNQTILVQASHKGQAPSSATGRAARVEGKAATISFSQRIHPDAKLRVYTLGKDDPTNAETERTLVILRALQGTSGIMSTKLARNILLDISLPSPSKDLVQHPIYPGPRKLNPSQTSAVLHILSQEESDRVCLIHGPPGTGKTTVIATAVQSHDSNRSTRGIWLMAQSNVAVKNIAEKLAQEKFWDFKLLVSKDFHFDWHEHLYHRIDQNVIRSERFLKEFDVVRELGSTRVILCTLSMISNPGVVAAGFTRQVPIETVIIDEASQIEIGDYLPLINTFGNGIKKLAFIGDDRQLAPFGQDDIGTLRSIFEVDHLRKRAVFLDTQYRMPGPIGSYISRHVYNGRLQTQHNINSLTSCRFVNVHHGKEVFAGNSYKNMEEINAVIHLARRYQEEGKSYRIITPYDGQRNALEKALKTANLAWEDKCFNVDSFQGNEDEHIILSVVRSSKVGFLKNLRRSNVMLSRCKKSMTICTSRTYLDGIASSTLLGKMAKEWGPTAWVSWGDLLAGKF